MEAMFSGYATIPAPSGDDLRPKWLAVCSTLNIAVQVPQITLAALAKWNVETNQAITYTAEPDGVNIWQTPAQTWARRRGDCKDYASLKYSLLFKAGVPETDLMVVCGDLTVGLIAKDPQHAFLVAMIDGRWRVFDSKFDQLIEPGDYINFVPVKGCSGNDVVLFSREFTLSGSVKD